MALFMMLGAWLVELGLQFNNNIFNAPAVQIGFSVSLAIANLGFVLGIIIIAIATIIRNQTYGIKQLLWKLVMMAILVNFGLVITAPIVGFANSMSNYFINATAPSAATGGYANYVLALTGAFNPQTTISAPTTGTGAWTSVCQSWLSTPIGPGQMLWGICHATGTQTTNPADNFWQNNIAMIFDIVFSSVAVFVFFCLAILLIIRYLMLGGLLIVLPLAWLTYVFPKFDNSYSKWWNTFIKWTLFPPLALFFIYLAFTTAVTTNTANNNAAATYTAGAIGGGSGNTDTTLPGALATETGLVGPKEGIFAQVADEILLAGLMIMGLMFASSLAGKAGATAVNMGTSASKAVGRYAGKQAKRAGSYGLRTNAGRKATEYLQTAGVGRNPLISGMLRPVRTAGNVIADRRASTEKLVSERQKTLGKMSLEEQGRRFGTQDAAGKLAILSTFDKALKGKDRKAKKDAKEALKVLPDNLRNEMYKQMGRNPEGVLGAKPSGGTRLDRLQTLYGKNEHATTSGGKAKSAADEFEQMLLKQEEKGEQRTEQQIRILENMREVEKKEAETEEEEISKPGSAGSNQTNTQQPPIIIAGGGGSGKAPRTSVVFENGKPVDKNS